MHLVAYLLDRHNRTRRENPPVTLRGYQPDTWVPAEFQFRNISLSVSRLAYSPCPTSRDLYFEHVEGMPRPETWPRVAGRAIDAIYKRIHETVRQYCLSTSASHFDLTVHMAQQGPRLIEEVLRSTMRNVSRIEPSPSQHDRDQLGRDLEKIVRFETILVSSTIERELAVLPNRSPGQIFDHNFDFTVQFGIDSRKHGLTSPATPDFLYHQSVIGDIKVGGWQPYYDYTMVAYALAYEEEQGSDMDLGAILLVQCPRSRRVPSHQGSRVEFLDDARRERFRMIRNRKLEIIAEKRDPGRAERQDDCERSCPYWDRCWGESSNG